jgi:hypothetical protein
MEFSPPDTNGRSRPQRRRQDKAPVAAKLVLDENVKGDIGVLSDDLFTALAPHMRSGKLTYDCSFANLAQTGRFSN